MFAGNPEDLSGTFAALREGRSLWTPLLAAVLGPCLLLDTFLSNRLTAGPKDNSPLPAGEGQGVRAMVLFSPLPRVMGGGGEKGGRLGARGKSHFRRHAAMSRRLGESRALPGEIQPQINLRINHQPRAMLGLQPGIMPSRVQPPRECPPGRRRRRLPLCVHCGRGKTENSRWSARQS